MLLQHSDTQPAKPQSRILSKAEAGFLEEVNTRLSELLDPSTETHVPILLSGARDCGLNEFLERALDKFGHTKGITNLVVFTPKHIDGVLQAQAEAFEAMYPSLNEKHLDELPPAFWCSLVKEEMGKQSPKRSRRIIIVDRLEELFDRSVAPGDRATFLKNLISIAQGYATSVVLVVDHNLIGQCDELRELKVSLGSRFHVRVPVIGHPVSEETTEAADWSKFTGRLSIEQPEESEEPAAQPAAAETSAPVAAPMPPRPKPTTAPVPIAAMIPPEKLTEAPWGDLSYDSDPVPVSSGVAPDHFWRRMTWVWMAGYGVALVMIVGLVILGTGLPDRPHSIASTSPTEPVASEPSPMINANEATPPSNLIPVSASSALVPPSLSDGDEIGKAIAVFENDNSNEPLSKKLESAFAKKQFGSAATWLKQASDGPNHLATELAFLYSRDEPKFHDVKKALTWFERAAAEECREGGFQAGQFYLFGSSEVERDAALGTKLLLDSANLGHAQSAYLMGVSRMHGLGTSRNYQLAQEWLDKSIAAGGLEGFQELAMMKERGIGCSPDRPAAAKLYREGAEAGSRFCMEKCAELLAQATGNESERQAAAEEWRRRALSTEENELQRRVRELAPGLYE